MTEQDKAVFCKWLEQGIVSSELMLKQFETMPVPKELIQRERTELMAMKIIHAKLSTTEFHSIG